jgi:hypothetical protein
MVNADFDVVLFNALKIYYFRSTVCDLKIETPQEIENSLKAILTITQRTFSTRSTELHDRLQWPLFLTGIETNDTIYQEWIFSRLTGSNVATSLQHILDAQALAGQRLSMMEIKDMLYSRTEHSLFASNIAFLTAFPEI